MAVALQRFHWRNLTGAFFTIVGVTGFITCP
jgi:hypothetical protein